MHDLQSVSYAIKVKSKYLLNSTENVCAPMFSWGTKCKGDDSVCKGDDFV